MLDPMAVFALLFGSELFEEYIGHLAVASMASSELAGESDNPEKVHDKLKASSVNPKFIVFLQVLNSLKVTVCLAYSSMLVSQTQNKIVYFHIVHS